MVVATPPDPVAPKTWQRVPRPQSVRHSLIIHSEFITALYLERVRVSSILCRRSVRNITVCNVGTFKAGLDVYLTLVPDESLIPGYTRYRGNSSNLLLDRPQGSVL